MRVLKVVSMEMGGESRQSYKWRYEFHWQILMKYVRPFFAKGIRKVLVPHCGDFFIKRGVGTRTQRGIKTRKDFGTNIHS